MSICSPYIDNNICYNKKDLLYLCNVYNKNHKDKINCNNKTKIKLFNELNKKYNKKNHYEWLKDKNISNNFYNLTVKKFKPEMPPSWIKNLNEWLSTIEINNVLYTYEKKYKDFKFYGAVPSDCPTEIYCKLSNLNINNLQNKNKNKIGIVYNLDTHEKKGSHWVAVMIDIENKSIFYFDANGIKPNKYIKKFIDELLKKINKSNQNKYKYIFNKKEVQKKDGQCGMFSICFIINYLKFNDFNKVINYNMTDKKMIELRKEFFIN